MSITIYLMRAVSRHTDLRWVLLYVERWLTAPFQQVDGTLVERDRGTPQGGGSRSAAHNPPYAVILTGLMEWRVDEGFCVMDMSSA